MSRRWLQIFLGALVLSVATDYFLLRGQSQAAPWGFDIWGSFAVFGLAGCLALVAVSKAIGHYWLDRGEDYYKAGDRDG